MKQKLQILGVFLAQGTAPRYYCEIGRWVKVPCPFKSEPGPAGQFFFGNLALEIINIALLAVGALAVIFLIWGGFRYITAFGNEEATESAKRIIKNAILGLIIVILSFAIITIITNVLVLGRP